MSDLGFMGTGFALIVFLVTTISLWRKKSSRLTGEAPLLASFDGPDSSEEVADPHEQTAAATYLHLRHSGRVFVVRGDTKEEYWTDRDGLREELARVKRAGGMILYSRQNPDQDPPEVVAQNFKIMTMAKVPLEMVADPHPFMPDESLSSPSVIKSDRKMVNAAA